MSTLKACRAARRDRVSVPTMRPAAEQLAILTETFSKAAKQPMSEADNRAALRSLALACVMTLDAMPA